MSTATTTATTRDPNSTQSSDDIIDTTTSLLSPGAYGDSNISPVRRSDRRQSLRDAVRFLRRASSRCMMREPLMLVHETAAEQLKERQSDWAYSKPVVILDIVWNFLLVAVAVLILSRDEQPTMPLRLWIIGYGLHCVLHMVCVCVEYKRRRRRRVGFGGMERGLGSDGNSKSGSRGESKFETSVHGSKSMILMNN